MRRVLFLVAGLIAVTGSLGCLRFGEGEMDFSFEAAFHVPEHINTIAVPQFVNDTDEPGIAAEARAALLSAAEEVNRQLAELTEQAGGEARFPRMLAEESLADDVAADATLKVRLVQYMAEVFDGAFFLTATAYVTLTDNHEQRLLWQGAQFAQTDSATRHEELDEAQDELWGELAGAILGRTLAEWVTVTASAPGESDRSAVGVETREHLYEVGRFYEKRREYRAALLYYDDLVSRFPRSPEAEAARARADRIRERLERRTDDEAGE